METHLLVIGFDSKGQHCFLGEWLGEEEKGILAMVQEAKSAPGCVRITLDIALPALPKMMPGQAAYSQREAGELVKLVEQAALGDPGEEDEPRPTLEQLLGF